MLRAFVLAALALAPVGALAEAGSADYAYVSALAAEGFEPFAVSQVGNASFGMRKGAEMYLCFIIDTNENQTRRQTVLLAELAGKAPDRAVPNIPLVCVLTQ
ncbi:hypothetical protein AL036_07655 [Salipiger aestuarii]|uniref:Uncharacterized protein n=1 Tax=Salipiger aestuarii TaxID=568098 RepID=A0A327Y9H6_9RHOB|nr:hypothetical protein [Salipiger aestuarii]EIE51902.1 hypothetical protein C357_06489 [Citreicella sp. 357]KAA8608337.1 hypothetical protein AL036_07655 [Salipiger aestuarii]KAA8612894.1 hypothetical protein AL037_07170 [Salipiger aestuarii]KAB2542196.1 hypothetical protein AL035_08260 [Salipiger aestuarii]RAK16832.1 hypothetical protein ATI53_101849 [Salipiger aestuarii]